MASVIKSDSEGELEKSAIFSSAEINQTSAESEVELLAPLDKKRAFFAWLILCYSTGPTSGVVGTYVTACIQNVANLMGHVPGSTQACASRGTILCVVKFGAGEIDYLSYLIYLRALSRALEGVVVIMLSGIADFSSYRKTMMMTSIFLFGVLALPFAGLEEKNYQTLTALSVLYVALTVVGGIYQVIESSYIPIFMRSAGLLYPRKTIRGHDGAEVEVTKTEVAKKSFVKGTRISVLGLVISNLGSVTALLIGLIITNTRGSYVTAGYHNYLLAITIAGCLTIVFASVGGWFLPQVPGKMRPRGTNLVALPFKLNWRLLKSVRRYPEAFKLCTGWILWYCGWSNYLQLIGSLFQEVTGYASGQAIYTIWTFTSIIFACLGSLTFMFVFPYSKFHVKTWAYVFLAVNIACVFWGTIGISNSVSIGYKQEAEFWVEQVLFMSTSSALRSYNRVLYASMLPKGSEAQFFGLEITLDLATGWINTLVQGVIQNSTHNLRFPMIPNLLLMICALGLYIWVDVDKGIEDAKVEMDWGGDLSEDTLAQVSREEKA